MHKIKPRVRKTISPTNGNTNNAVVEKVIKINEMALIFALRLMPRWVRQSRINCPNALWFSNQFSNRGDDLEKAHAATRILTVVGIPGINMPINPMPTKINPMVKYKYRTINCCRNCQ